MTDDRELFWQLLQPEYTRAMMFCRKLTGHRERGDDLFQDALVTALTGPRAHQLEAAAHKLDADEKQVKNHKEVKHGE